MTRSSVRRRPSQRSAGKPIPAVPRGLTERLLALTGIVGQLQTELRAAIARKPNQTLVDCVYQLKAVRQELADVQERLAANTALLERYVRVMEQAPVAKPATTERTRGWHAYR